MSTQADPVSDRLLCIDEVMDRWAVSKRTVERLIGDGRLPVVRIGKQRRFQMLDIVKFENSNRS